VNCWHAKQDVWAEQDDGPAALHTATNKVNKAKALIIREKMKELFRKRFFDFFGIAVFGVSSYFAMLSLKIWVAINLGSIAN
jgi:hypothetical protein